MRQALKAWAGITGVLILLIAAFAWGRLRPPTPAQAEALKLLQPAPTPPGRNAWPMLWLVDYDVPVDRIDAVYAQERVHMQAWARERETNPSAAVVTYKPLAASQYPKRPVIDAADRDLLCAAREGDCLAKVRIEGQALHGLLARQAGRLAQIEAMNSADAMWDDPPHGVYPSALLPEFVNTEDLLLTATAMDFVEGRQAQALDAVCRQAASVRRLHANTNSLVASMVAVNWMEADERLLAAMLREIPSSQAVPGQCVQAFAPPAQADVSLCAPMQYEFEATASAIEMMEPDRLHGFKRLRMAVLVDTRGIRRLRAPTFAWACQREMQGIALADRVLPTATVPAVRYDLFDAFSNTVGLILARIAGPAYTKYAARNEDYAASLRVMAWLLHSRATTTAAGWQQQLAQALPTLRESGHRSISIDPDGRFLRMRYYAARPDHTELVLPLMK